MTDSTSNPTSDTSSTSTDTDLTKLFEKPISEEQATSLGQLSQEELLQGAVLLEEMIDDYERHVTGPNERSEPLEMLDEVLNAVRSVAKERQCASEADHVINAIEPVWASVEHVFDPETGRPTEVALNNRELIESLHDASEYECSCGEKLSDWSAVRAHLEKQAANDNNDDS